MLDELVVSMVLWRIIHHSYVWSSVRRAIFHRLYLGTRLQAEVVTFSDLANGELGFSMHFMQIGLKVINRFIVHLMIWAIRASVRNHRFDIFVAIISE